MSCASPAEQEPRDYKEGEYAHPDESNVLRNLNRVVIGLRRARVAAWQRASTWLRLNGGFHGNDTHIAIVDDEVHAWTLDGCQPEWVEV
jgi:hypothetical protein